MKKINQNYYSLEKVKFMNRNLVQIDNGGKLFSNGIYYTKLIPEDLPESFVEGIYYGHNKGFLNAAGVKDLLYVPNYNINHMFKDDFLYISYNSKMQMKKRGFSHEVIGYDHYVWGYNIVNFLKAAEIYSNYDISTIKDEIEKKRIHFKNTYPDAYALEVGSSKFF